MLDADDVRRIALSFPQTEEKQRWNHPTFDVAGRMFVTVPDDPLDIASMTREERDRLKRHLVAANPEVARQLGLIAAG